jgi:hypothetical protein
MGIISLTSVLTESFTFYNLTDLSVPFYPPKLNVTVTLAEYESLCGRI